MMTIHSAKGLEFDCVFISGLEEGLFPHENSASDLDGLEEERRLMYVAITRARKRLYLSFAQTRMLHGQTRYNVKSRFLDELPEARCAGSRRATRASAPALRASTARPGRAARACTRSSAPAAAPAFGAGPDAQAGVDARPALRAGRVPRQVRRRRDLTLEGSGDDARAQVNFGRHGLKWLALSVAKLTPVD